MSRATVLAAGRRAAEAGMVDTCVITDVTATSTNRDTGQVTVTPTTVYTGPCRLQEIFGFSREVNPSPDQSQLARYRVLQLPVATSTGIRVGQHVQMTSCVNDPDMATARFIVRDQSGKTDATSRRVGVEELTG